MKSILVSFVLLSVSTHTLAQDITKMLPGPPDTKSMEFVSDYMEYKWAKTARDESTGKLAYNFIMWDSQSFLRSLSKGINLTLSESTTPKIVKLLDYATERADEVTTAAQESTGRDRPYVMFGERSFVTAYESKYKGTGSYPCDQAVKGWLYSLLLSEVSPKKIEAILERGMKYGPAMTIAGYSFKSDVDAGHLLACALFSRMHADSQFKYLMSEAKAEYIKLTAGTRAADDPYIPASSLPNAVKYLPAPPEELSCQQMCDIVAYNEGKLLRQEDAGQQAIEDTDYSADRFCEIFSEVLGHEISKSKTPAIYELLYKVHPSGNAATQLAKAEYQRPRPYVYMGEGTSYPSDEADLRATGSYPSGHASGSWLMALVMSEVAQTRQDELLARAYEFGQGRVITGYHWQSDVNAGRLVGSAVYTYLHNDNEFVNQMKKAINEYQSVYGTSGIRTSATETGNIGSAPIYNLQGQRTDTPAKGIYIQGNSKIIKK